jgi:hypothetical protein
MPPLYPADIYRDSPINLQVGAESNRWTFGADGTLTLPGDLNVGSNSIREDGLFSQQFSIAAGAGKRVEISSDDGEKVWSFDTNGKLTLPGSILFPNALEYTEQGIITSTDTGLGISLSRNLELSAVAAVNSGEGQLYIDISENDDISIADKIGLILI